MAYINDELIPSKDFDEGLEHLEEVLRVLRNAKLALRLTKCKFLASSIAYLWFDIEPSGVNPVSSR